MLLTFDEVVTFDTLSYISIFLIGMALPFCGGGFAVEIVRDRETKARQKRCYGLAVTTAMA